jgi:hypothetical protein
MQIYGDNSQKGKAKYFLNISLEIVAEQLCIALIVSMEDVIIIGPGIFHIFFAKILMEKKIKAA